MPKGDRVRLRAYGGQEIVRRVVEEINDRVYVCRDEEYEAALAEGREPVSVGFRVEDVLELTAS